MIAPPVNRWQCSVCDGEAGEAQQTPAKRVAAVMMDLTLRDEYEAANEWPSIAGGRDWAELCLLPTDLKINIVLCCYYRHLAAAFILCDIYSSTV